MNEKERLMRELQALQFSLVDLAEFLDTHPDNAPALRMFKQLSAKAHEAKDRYEASFGSVTSGGSGNEDYWDWTATPFPWEN